MENRPTEVLILTTGLHIGGAEVVIQRLAETIDRRKYNLTICCTKVLGSIGDYLVSKGFEVIPLTKQNSVRNNYLSFLALLKVVRSKHIHIVHTHTVDALADAVICKLLTPRVKLVHTYHYGNYPRTNRKLMLYERLFSKAADTLVAVGEVQRSTILGTYTIPSKKLKRVWNGVNAPSNEGGNVLRDGLGLKTQLIVGTIATFTEQKGLDDLLEVARHFAERDKELCFVVVGDGYLRKRLEEKVRKYHLENIVKFPGWIKDAVNKALPEFDIFFMPSLWEAMSIALLEAMAAGKAIVATGVGENPYVLEHGKEGLIVNKKDIKGMKEAIDTLLDDKALREGMGKAAAIKAKREYTVNKMTKEYENIYRELML